MSALPRVSLIVVNWNGRAYLEACLSSLLALDYPDFSVVVVDNASTDGSPDFIRDRFGQVELHLQPAQSGLRRRRQYYSRATVAADVAVVLNTDLSVPRDWLANLVGADDGRCGNRDRRVQAVLSWRPDHPACRRIYHEAPGLARPLWIE